MKRIAFLLLFLLARPSWSAIAFVQAKACHTTSGVTSTCVFDSQVTATNLLIVACAGSRLGAALTVTDDQNDVYTLIGGTTTTGAPSGSTLIWGIWYSTNVVGDFTTVTCSDANSNTTWIEQSIHEYSGASAATDPFDVASSTSSSVSITTTTMISGFAQTATDNELAFAFVPQMPSAAITGNGTIRTNTVDNAFWATEDAIVSVAGVYQSSFTFVSGLTTEKMSQAFFKLPPNPPPGVHSWR